MCGIIGYIGKKEAIPILIDGLKRLEYRGYDSAGIAVSDNGKIYLAKAKGRVIELERKISANWSGNSGIAHTRWATHGEPNEQNAHPHTDCSGKIFVCHNGIIENYKELKDELIFRGHKFKSETDTEVLSHLIEENLRYGPEPAVVKSLKSIKGTYGITVLFADYPDSIIAARNSSPLVIGIGNGEHLIASDASAILKRTRDVIYMNDGEMAVIKANSVKLLNITDLSAANFKSFNVSNFKNINISSRKEKLDWGVDDVSKNDYPHFMLKEIFEQPESILNSFRGRLVKEEGNVKLGGLESVKDKLKKINRIIITGCGTAYLAGTIGKLMIEELSGIPCEVELASELRYQSIADHYQNLAMVAISQSGETADTLAALRRFSAKRESASGKKEKNILTLGIVNVVGSTIARETDAGVYNHAGPEIGVASTKAFTSQLMVLALLALFLGRQRNLSKLNGKKFAEELSRLPQLCRYVLIHSNKTVKVIAEKYKNFNNFLYIGRKYNLGTALEGALKLKEISYIHAEGYGAGEMKHGPIAMINENFPIVAIAPEDSVYDKMASNMEEIKARRGKIIAITTEGNKKIKHIADDWLYIPKTLEILTPILAVIPLQLFAYYMGVLRGIDVDKPRNLAKSVTVE
ncbi:MAG: glutamine--fructose-6-phosphate transaminase (isomerizing) [bacterium]|nr:glutamine--fructose-6-phosphate transaminase (isomerizing) [bacterium]